VIAVLEQLDLKKPNLTMSNKTNSNGEYNAISLIFFYHEYHATDPINFQMINYIETSIYTKDIRSGEIDPVQEQLTGRVREVGNYAIWSLSSCKPGFGVDQLRDDITETYWQSDGQLPHLVNIQFKRKTTIRDICIYTDYKLDESYTPNR